MKILEVIIKDGPLKGLEGKVKAEVKEVKNEVVKATAKTEKKTTKNLQL